MWFCMFAVYIAMASFECKFLDITRCLYMLHTNDIVNTQEESVPHRLKRH